MQVLILFRTTSQHLTCLLGTEDHGAMYATLRSKAGAAEFAGLAMEQAVASVPKQATFILLLMQYNFDSPHP